MRNRLIETAMGSDWPLVKNLLLVGLVAFVMSASALELPEFISTNNVTELRYREWGAVSGPVQTVKIEFAIRRVEISSLRAGGDPAIGPFFVCSVVKPYAADLPRFAARLISARQFRYKTPTSLKMMKAKENILLYLGDFATCSQMSRYR